MDIDRYLQTYRLPSEQVSKREISIVLHELQRVVSHVSGDIVEFGCYEGTTSVPIAVLLKDTNRTLYLYDSFEGLPAKLPQDLSPAGEQFATGELLASRKVLVKRLKQAHVPLPVIKKAWFNNLNDRDVPHEIAFAFLDGDYYESIKTPLELIEPYLTPGGTIIIDDYANEALPGAARAVDEWANKKRVTVRVESSLAIIRL